VRLVHGITTDIQTTLNGVRLKTPARFKMKRI